MRRRCPSRTPTQRSPPPVSSSRWKSWTSAACPRGSGRTRRPRSAPSWTCRSATATQSSSSTKTSGPPSPSTTASPAPWRTACVTHSTCSKVIGSPSSCATCRSGSWPSGPPRWPAPSSSRSTHGGAARSCATASRTRVPRWPSSTRSGSSGSAPSWGVSTIYARSSWPTSIAPRPRRPWSSPNRPAGQPCPNGRSRWRWGPWTKPPPRPSSPSTPRTTPPSSTRRVPPAAPRVRSAPTGTCAPT